MLNRIRQLEKQIQSHQDGKAQNQEDLRSQREAILNEGRSQPTRLLGEFGLRDLLTDLRGVLGVSASIVVEEFENKYAYGSWVDYGWDTAWVEVPVWYCGCKIALRWNKGWVHNRKCEMFVRLSKDLTFDVDRRLSLDVGYFEDHSLFGVARRTENAISLFYNGDFFVNPCGDDLVKVKDNIMDRLGLIIIEMRKMKLV